MPPFCPATAPSSLVLLSPSLASVSLGEASSSCWVISRPLEGVDDLGLGEFEFFCHSGMLAPPLPATPIGVGEGGNWCRLRSRPFRVESSSLSWCSGWPLVCWAREVWRPVTWAVSSCMCCCCSDNSACTHINTQSNGRSPNKACSTVVEKYVSCINKSVIVSNFGQYLVKKMHNWMFVNISCKHCKNKMLSKHNQYTALYSFKRTPQGCHVPSGL